MKINMVVTDVVNDVTYSRKRVNTRVIITIVINAGCWRADCDVLIHDGAAGVN